MTSKILTLPDQISIARKRFEDDLIDEHLEEVSFLYDQRLYLLSEDKFSWQDVRDNEERFSKHLSSLLMLGPNISERCLEAYEDAGGLHAVICLLCRNNEIEKLGNVIRDIDLSDEENFEPVVNALRQEAPESWQKEIHKLLDPANDCYIDLIASIYGYRRWPLDCLTRLRPQNATPTLVCAIGRSDSPAWFGLLQETLESDDESLKKEASISLLRHGHRDHLSRLIENTTDKTWPMLPLGLGGNLAVQQRLMRIAASNPNKDCLLALGMLGDCSAVDLLLPLLAEENLAKAASLSLNLITGAELYEEVFIPEEIDEDTLFEEELEKLKKGEPLYPPGDEPGEVIERLSHNPEQWKSWWRENQSRFKKGIRFRFGKPYSPAVLVDTLELPRSPRIVKKLAYEELVIRYKADIPFEIDMLVTAQLAAIVKYRRWSHNNQRLFKAGKWY